MTQDHIVVDEERGESFEETVAKINASLFKLRELCYSENLDDPKGRKRYRDNVVALKGVYEQTERGLLDGVL